MHYFVQCVHLPVRSGRFELSVVQDFLTVLPNNALFCTVRAFTCTFRQILAWYGAGLSDNAA
jgi:hypothetical protein